MKNIDIENKIPIFLKNSKIYDVVATDLFGYYTFVNDTFKSRFSFLTDNFIGKHSSTSFHHDDLSKAEEAVMQCLSNLEQPVKLQLRKPLKTEHGYYWTQWEFSVIQDEEHTPLGILCVGYDVTESKFNVEELRRSQIKLNKIIEAVPHPLLLLDQNNKIKLVNKEFETIFKYSISDIYDKSIELLLDEKIRKNYNALIQDFRENFKESKIYDKLISFKTKNKELKYVGISINLFYDHNNSQNLVLILQDLTVFKENQEIILRQNKSLRDIASKHSHEIRKPVSSILALSELIKTEEAVIKNKEVLDFIKNSAVELDEITKAIVSEANESEYNARFRLGNRFFSNTTRS